MTTETDVWTGQPSQLCNLRYFIVSVLFCWLLIPLGFMFWRWLETRCTHYRLTNERLITTSGVLNRSTNQIELYRIRDYQIDEPFWMRVFGLAYIHVISTDRTDKNMELKAIKGGANLISLIRDQVEALRQHKRRIG